jgi:hypothetical protein
MIIEINSKYIYNLILDGVVVYVGQTTNIINRIFSHKADKGKIYDSVRLYPLSDDECLSTAEFIQIVKHTPILNKTLPSLSYVVYRQRVDKISECIKDIGLDVNDFYDTNKPDMTQTLNGHDYHLWAKKGFEDKFTQLEDRLNEN